MFLSGIDYKRQIVHLCSVANFECICSILNLQSQMKEGLKKCLKENIHYIGGASNLKKICRKKVEIN